MRSKNLALLGRVLQVSSKNLRGIAATSGQVAFLFGFGYRVWVQLALHLKLDLIEAARTGLTWGGVAFLAAYFALAALVSLSLIRMQRPDWPARHGEEILPAGLGLKIYLDEMSRRRLTSDGSFTLMNFPLTAGAATQHVVIIGGERKRREKIILEIIQELRRSKRKVFVYDPFDAFITSKYRLPEDGAIDFANAKGNAWDIFDEELSIDEFSFIIKGLFPVGPVAFEAQSLIFAVYRHLKEGGKSPNLKEIRELIEGNRAKLETILFDQTAKYASISDKALNYIIQFLEAVHFSMSGNAYAIRNWLQSEQQVMFVSHFDESSRSTYGLFLTFAIQRILSTNWNGNPPVLIFASPNIPDFLSVSRLEELKGVGVPVICATTNVSVIERVVGAPADTALAAFGTQVILNSSASYSAIALAGHFSKIIKQNQLQSQSAWWRKFVPDIGLQTRANTSIRSHDFVSLPQNEAIIHFSSLGLSRPLPLARATLSKPLPSDLPQVYAAETGPYLKAPDEPVPPPPPPPEPAPETEPVPLAFASPEFQVALDAMLAGLLTPIELGAIEGDGVAVVQNA